MKCWTTLYGDFEKSGIALRRVRCLESRVWLDAIEVGAVHLFLNLQGTSLVFGQSARLPMVSKTLGVCHVGSKDGLTANFAHGEEQNEMIVLCVTPAWVDKNFGSRKQSLHENLVTLLDSRTQHSTLLNKVRSMNYLEYELCSSLLDPPVHHDAKSFWFLAKIIELLSFHLFKPANSSASEPFCSSQKRAANERVNKVLIWLQENLDQPLDLQALAAEIHCSSSYLSRVFSEHTGTTIMKRLRAMRIEKAATLLQDGDFNVTEAAMEVGYNSLSHFTKAFQEEKGIKPSVYIKQNSPKDD